MQATPRQAIIYLLRGPEPAMEYVGVTTLTPLQRLYRHRTRAIHEGRNSKLYQSMREHGVKNFTIEILEKINSDDANAERRHILARNAHTTGLNTRLPREWVPPQLPQPSPNASLGALVPYTHD